MCSHASTPTVSVVIPVYNRPAAVRRAIASVLAQTRQDFEVIVVDDGSTDESAESARSLCDRRVRCIRHDRNLGASVARNAGIRASSGRYVAFLDSDDEWLPRKLERQVALLEARPPEVGLVYTGALLVFPGAELEMVPTHRGAIARTLLTLNVVGSASTGMVRRHVLAEVGGFDEELPAKQDLDLWLRVSERYLADFVPEALVRLAKGNDGSRITANVAFRVRARETFLRKHRGKLVREGLLHAYLRESGRVFQRDVGDLRLARALYRQAIAAKPTAPLSYLMLLAACLPPSWPGGLARWGRCLDGLVRRRDRKWLSGSTQRVATVLEMEK